MAWSDTFCICLYLGIRRHPLGNLALYFLGENKKKKKKTNHAYFLRSILC